MELKEFDVVIKQRVLQETLKIIREHKIISIEELAQLKHNSRDVLLIEVGALECLGCVMIKYGTNIKVIALREDDAIYRYKERFIRKL
jgi:predicted transcriptional regulator